MEIKIRWIVEQDEIAVCGNALASGDDAEDKACEDEILRRLDRGDVWAWCFVTCEASCEVEGVTFKGRDTLGGCSYKDRKDFMTCNGNEMKILAINDMREAMFTTLRRAVPAGRALSLLHDATITEE
jgi:hypothetical protein